METTDNDLIMKAQSGDRDSFDELVQRYDRRVLSMALSYSRNREDAKDIYQEVFIRVYRALPGFQFRSKFSTWLHRVTTNVCLTHQSRRRDHLFDSLDEEDDSQERTRSLTSDALASQEDTEQECMASEISFQIRNAMELLSPQQRLVFALRHYEGHKIREIAAIMNCAQGTIKKYLFTATERIRNELRPLYRPESMENAEIRMNE